MDPRDLKELLEKVSKGALSPDEAAARLATLPYEDLGFAKLDHHRALRRGFPEAIFGAGKTPEQILAIVGRIAARGQRVLVTRTNAEVHARVAAVQPKARPTRPRAASRSRSSRLSRFPGGWLSRRPAPPTCRWPRRRR